MSAPSPDVRINLLLNDKRWSLCVNLSFTCSILLDVIAILLKFNYWNIIDLLIVSLNLALILVNLVLDTFKPCYFSFMCCVQRGGKIYCYGKYLFICLLLPMAIEQFYSEPYEVGKMYWKYLCATQVQRRSVDTTKCFHVIYWPCMPRL